MQLPQFISRMLGFAESVESNLKSNLKAAQELATAQGRIADLEGQLAATKDLLTKAQGDTTTAQATIAARDTEITALRAEVQTEKGRATATIAAQGLPLAGVPPADPTGNGQGVSGEKAWDKYQRLLATNPREAGAFWGQHADEILASRMEN